MGPPILRNHGAGLYTGTFTFTGALCGTDFLPGNRPCLVEFPLTPLPGLTGAGTVDVAVTGQTVLQATRAIYAFTSSSSAIPEPASALLLAPAIALLNLALLRCKSTR